MQVFSSPKSQFPLFPSPSSPNPNSNPNLIPRSFAHLPIRSFSSLPLLRSPPSSSKTSSPAPLQEQVLSSVSDDDEIEEDLEDPDEGGGLEGLLVVRRPVKEGLEEAAVSSLVESDKTSGGEEKTTPSSNIDKRLSEFAKKMPMFEPERVVGSGERPLGINLELALYRAKVLIRNFQFKEAEEILLKCISFWPEDGRAYVAQGKLLCKQSKFAEARSVYERGCQATQGENSYIWQCWAVLENKAGNIRRARELFDAATVADKKHIAAWHGWAVLEIKQGNIKKARNLLTKGLKYCGGNEYIYQTLALLEAKGKRFKRARYLFQQATKCNPKSCASWLAWAQVEMQQQNNYTARKLFEKAVQASPKNRFAWHIWALFEANQGDIDKGRKLLKIGHAVNPRDPVILQSLALLEYRHSSANLARVLFRKASALDPRHQPVWIAWGWMEWKEGNINTARELYQRALSIDSTTESAARCLQAWGVLEQRNGNLTVARRLFRSSLNINSQSYITWMTWASLEEQQGNPVRAEEIRNLYYQQRTEVVDDASWIMGFVDIIDPALDSVKRLLNLDQSSDLKGQEILRSLEEANYSSSEASSNPDNRETEVAECIGSHDSDFDLDGFVGEKLSLDVSDLDALMEAFEHKRTKSRRRRVGIWERKIVLVQH
ncbi:protein high chlorophyll fluorescent 107-like isoform X2 [Musa acuminata AAA Group]|uniref:protein high chlorophyll fluorescent 107-like isoform X2 n=1 Tax=Musa acuminata AAA Group TaxID=214697 RepID=UPI0031D158D4